MFQMFLASTWPGMTLRQQDLVCKQPLLGWNGPTALPTRTSQAQLPLYMQRKLPDHFGT